MAEFLFRISSRKLIIVVSFTAIGLYLNNIDKLTDPVVYLLVGLAGVYCSSNLIQKKLQPSKNPKGRKK